MIAASSSHFEFLAHSRFIFTPISNPNRFHFSNPNLMDFHSLSRRELQALCKLNKIPANITNVAMADALKSLQTVEGIEEVLNPSRSETTGSSIESAEELEVTSPRVPRTICRTSTRPARVKKTETESVPATASRTAGRGVRRQLAGEVNELKTPMVSTTRKKVPTTSCRNVESQLNECEEGVDHEAKCIPNTPAAVATYSRRKGATAIAHQDTVKKEATVQRVYSTRRSTRLTAKKSAEPGVMERERSEPVKMDSFLDEANVASEENLGLVPEKSARSGCGSIDTPHESNISYEDTEDKVGEGSAESCDAGVSKAKVEDICNAFEKLDVLVVEGSGQNSMIKEGLNVDPALESKEEKVDCFGKVDNNIEMKSAETFEQGMAVDSEEMLNVEQKLVLNEADNSEEKDDQLDNLKPEAVLVPEEHSDSLLSEADDVDADADADASAVSIDTKNSNDPLMMKLEDTSFAVLETKKEVSECNVDVVVDDAVNSTEQDPKMDFEAPADEPQESLIEEADVNAMDLNSEQLNQKADQTMDDGDVLTQDDVNAIDLNSEQLNQEADQTMDDGDVVTHESAADAIDHHPIQLSPMKQQDLSEMSSDNDENNEVEGEVVAEENKIVNEKAVDEKAKSANEMSIRQLKKQLKAMSIKNNTDKDDKVGEARPALQAVCDNQMVTEDMED